MPMLYIRKNFDNISFTKQLYWLTLFLVITNAICYEQNLSARMCMPIVSCSGFKHNIRYLAI